MSLKQALAEHKFVVAPGVFDMISLKIADQLGFPALYMTGYGTVASYLGLPDAGLATYTDMLHRAAAMAQVAKTPLVADADTGYGGLLNVRHTVRGYEKAGVSAIQIEDQEFPKKCGHTPHRRVIPTSDMVNKIKVAADARSSADFLIIARTDSRTSLGLDEALRRGEAYAEAGADILFIESPESEAEMAKIGSTFSTPLLANMVDGGKTPILSAENLEALGYRMAIYPAAGFLAMGAALNTVYASLRDVGSTEKVKDRLFPFSQMNELMGFHDVWDFEARYNELPPSTKGKLG